MQHISQLDVERFGFQVAKIDCHTLDQTQAILNQLDQSAVKLIIARAKSHAFPVINFLEKNGFRLKDSQVTYRYEMKKINGQQYDLPKNVMIRDHIASDVEHLVEMSKESFQGYGHYFANERLCKQTCAEIYPDWARRSCTDKQYADKIFVAEMDGMSVGFLSFKLQETNGLRYAKGGMGAVAKEYRKFGIFQALVKAGLMWGKEINLEWEEHNVLCTNFPVNRSFSSLGFTIADAFMTLHCWKDE